MLTLEILSVAIVNYYTSSPEIFKPTHVQMSQVKNLLLLVQNNLHVGIDLILKLLPSDYVQSEKYAKLQ